MDGYGSLVGAGVMQQESAISLDNIINEWRGTPSNDLTKRARESTIAMYSRRPMHKHDSSLTRQILQIHSTPCMSFPTLTPASTRRCDRPTITLQSTVNGTHPTLPAVAMRPADTWVSTSLMAYSSKAMRSRPGCTRPHLGTRAICISGRPIPCQATTTVL